MDEATVAKQSGVRATSEDARTPALYNLRDIELADLPGNTAFSWHACSR